MFKTSSSENRSMDMPLGMKSLSRPLWHPYSSLPRAIRMRKVHLGTKTLELRQSLKFKTVIGRHRLKNLAEAFCAIQLLQLCKSRFNAGTGTSGDANGDVASRNLFNSGEYYCLTACALTNDCIHFPVSNLRTIIDDGRTFLNGAPLHTLVFTHLFTVVFVSQGPRARRRATVEAC